ncbi:hypothetical protein ABZ490_22275 [Streptomyces sp. NPDC005811]|uniref:hypothetical protein n=1 Tax=Streptomyces sp. NPDC005811 TaxID=3154565 RepID=UPI0033E83F4D
MVGADVLQETYLAVWRVVSSAAAQSLSPALQRGSTADWVVAAVALAAITPLAAVHFRRLTSGN